MRVLTLNRPDKLNAWDGEMRARMRDAIEGAATDADLRVLIITGAGRAFSAGEDVAGMEDLSKAGTRRFRAVARTIHATFDLIEALEVPVIAAVNGVAAGGGCELALSCDFRVMAEGSRLVLPEGRVGLIPGSGGCSRLVKHVGLGRAKEMIMLGRSIEPDLARQIGLATEVAPAGEALGRRPQPRRRPRPAGSSGPGHGQDRAQHLRRRRRRDRVDDWNGSARAS